MRNYSVCGNKKKIKNYSNNDNYLHYDNELFIGSTIYRAFIHEMYRISSIVSQGVDHANLGKELTVRVSEEDSFDNKEHEYTIPADTVIIYNSEYIHTYNKKRKLGFKFNRIVFGKLVRQQ